jgi:hypothetical protein
MGRSSSDPAVKSNANASLSELKRLQLTNRGDTDALPKESAWQMLVRFSDMEAQGKGLTEDGRRNLSQFFVEPPAKGDGKILVVQDYRVPRWASIYGNKADVTVMMKVLGFLYPSFRYESSAAYGTSTFEEENTYELELRRGSQQAGPDTEGPTNLNVGQLTWKIVDVVRHTDGVEKPSPAFAAEWITVPAACCYLTQALAKTKDPTTRMNVQRSLTVMNHLLTSTQPKQSARTATSSPACAP